MAALRSLTESWWTRYLNRRRHHESTLVHWVQFFHTLSTESHDVLLIRPAGAEHYIDSRPTGVTCHTIVGSLCERNTWRRVGTSTGTFLRLTPANHTRCASQSMNFTCPSGFVPHEPGHWANGIPVRDGVGDRTNNTMALCARKCSVTEGCAAFEAFQQELPAAVRFYTNCDDFYTKNDDF